MTEIVHHFYYDNIGQCSSCIRSSFALKSPLFGQCWMEGIPYYEHIRDGKINGFVLLVAVAMWLL